MSTPVVVERTLQRLILDLEDDLEGQWCWGHACLCVLLFGLLLRGRWVASV